MTTTLINNENITSQVLDFLLNRSRKEAYLLNNKFFFGNFISKEQYDVNHKFISKTKQNG